MTEGTRQAHREIARQLRRSLRRLLGAMALNEVPFYLRAGFRPCAGRSFLTAGGALRLSVLPMEKLLGFILLIVLPFGVLPGCDGTDLRLDRKRPPAGPQIDAGVGDGDAAEAGRDGGDAGPPSSPLPWLCDTLEPEEAPTSLEQCDATATECGPPNFTEPRFFGCDYSSQLGEFVEAALVACEPNGWSQPCGPLYLAVREGCVVKARYTFSSYDPLNSDWSACLTRRLVGRRLTCAASSAWMLARYLSCLTPPP